MKFFLQSAKIECSSNKIKNIYSFSKPQFKKQSKKIENWRMNFHQRVRVLNTYNVVLHCLCYFFCLSCWIHFSYQLLLFYLVFLRTAEESTGRRTAYVRRTSRFIWKLRRVVLCKLKPLTLSFMVNIYLYQMSVIQLPFN